MRNLIAVMLLAVAVSPCVLGQPDPMAQAVAVFDDANRHYQAGAYAEAIAQYQQAEASGYESGPLYYNMANAYYRLDEVGQAVRYYERARLLMPESPEVAHNLSIVRAGLTDQLSILPEPFWERWWVRIEQAVGSNLLFAFGVVFYVLAMGLVGYRIWKEDRNPWLRRVRWMAFLMGGLFLLAAFFASLREARPGPAVVITDATPLRLSPSGSAEAELQVHEGLMLDVLQESDAWTRVRLPNGQEGWVAAASLASI
ncbi:MAG: SH3 domain-containing protein [Bacteroidota bacterium]